MDGGHLTVAPSSVGAISAPDRRARQRPDLDLDDSTSTAERLFQWLLVATWPSVAVITLAYGLPYYLVPLALRDTSPLDKLLRPSGVTT